MTDESRLGPSRAARLAALGVLALIAAPFLLRLELIERRGFNPDELEHTHFAWCISRGMVPHRDYFEHHTPWLHLLLQPLFHRYDATASPDEALALLAAGRRWMWAFAGTSLALTFLIARSMKGSAAAGAAVLLLANAPVFLGKSLEIRPDVPALAFLLGALWLVRTALVRRAGDQPAARWLFGCGVALGAAAMFTQKVAFALPGFALGLAWEDQPGTPTRGRRLRSFLPLAAGALLPPLATVCYFARAGALWPFVHQNVIVNLAWPGLGAREFLLAWVREDPVFVGLAAAGLGRRLPALRRREVPGEGVAAGTLLSMVVALAFHPAVTFHYFLLFLPMAAVFGGSALVTGLSRLLAALGRVASAARRRAGASLAALLGALLLWVPARMATGPEPHRVEWACLAAAAAALAVALARRSRAAALLLVLVLASLPAAARLRTAFARGNWMTVQGIRYVLRNVAPGEACLDGFTGLGAFRPHAFFHPFQNAHTLAIQTPAQRAELLSALQSGRVVPKVVFWNHYLEDGVTPEVRAFLLRHYVPSGVEPIRVRPFDNGLGWWSDEAARPFGWGPGTDRAPHVLFDDRWRVPGHEDGVPVRRTRTARAGLVVPVRRPRDFRATLRAKADRPGLPFTVELVVNGHSTGHVEATPRWRDYVFALPSRFLVPGFNGFELRFFPGAPEDGRRTELSIESLTLRPVARAPAPPDGGSPPPQRPRGRSRSETSAAGGTSRRMLRFCTSR
jgi:hypothetical protein